MDTVGVQRCISSNRHPSGHVLSRNDTTIFLHWRLLRWPLVVIGRVNSSCTNSSVIATCAISPCADSSGIRCGGDAECTGDRRTIGADEVQLVSSKNHTMSAGTKIGEAQKWCEGHAAPHTYREDACRRAPERAFLHGGFVPPKLDKDAPAVATMMVVAAAGLDGTCEIPEMWDSSINTGRILIPLLVSSYR
jgi:hypothetical protein